MNRVNGILLKNFLYSKQGGEITVDWLQAQFGD